MTTDNITFPPLLIKICSEVEDRNKRLEELKSLLLSRDYKLKLINAAIEKAIKIPRSTALNRVEKSKETRRPVFAIYYDPRLPSIPGIIRKHWRTMVHSDPHLKETFPVPPLVA